MVNTSSVAKILQRESQKRLDPSERRIFHPGQIFYCIIGTTRHPADEEHVSQTQLLPAVSNPPNVLNLPSCRRLAGEIRTADFPQKRGLLPPANPEMRTVTMSQQQCPGPCQHSECIPSLSLADYGLYLNHQLNNRMLSLGNWNLPCFALADQSRNRNFVGRDDILDQMDEQLLPHETSLPADMTSVRSFAICGPSGIGKTELAIEYAHSRRHQFGAVFWLHAGSAAQLMNDYCQIPGYLGLANVYSHPGPESRRRLAKAWLNNPKKSVDWGVNCRWLLIFDNVDDLDIVESYLPRGGNGSVLITSRDPSAMNRFFEHADGVDLDPLSEDEAATLLQRLVVGSDEGLDRSEQDAFATLASTSGGVPAAIVQIAESVRWN